MTNIMLRREVIRRTIQVLWSDCLEQGVGRMVGRRMRERASKIGHLNKESCYGS